MRFLVDSMAGKLARYLRLLGFDAEYHREGDIKSLVRKAREEKRIVLTRNTAILDFKGKIDFFFLPTEKTDEQVRAVLKHFKLKDKIDPFTRCLECNTPLEKVFREKVKGLVPFHVYRVHQEFYYCPGCKRIYRRGTHREKLEEKIRKFLEDSSEKASSL